VDVAKCAGLAREKGASMLFLPECFGFMGESSLQTLEQAEPPIMGDQSENEGTVQEQLCCAVRYPHENTFAEETENVSLLDGLKVIARTSGMWISAGGMHESGASPDDDNGGLPRVYNTHVIVDSDGKVQTLYRKSHLFDVSIPNKVNLRESATTAPGTKLVVCDSPVGMYVHA
jgi:predicted amidohydrolase